MGRIVVIVIALLLTDAYLWHGGSTHMAIATSEGLASDFSDQVARHLQPHH